MGIHGDRERSSLTDRLVSRELRLGSASELYVTDCMYEIQDMFQRGPGDRPSIERIAGKALLALPLLTRGNTLELAVRPQRDIVMTIGRRAMLRSYRAGDGVSPKEGTIAVDTHVHTRASADSLTPASEILFSAARHGLTGIAITDHDTLEGALTAVEVAERMKREGKLPAGFFVIVGEEISSSDGHIIALFLTREIPPAKSAEWTVQAIHDQGGLAIAAHPMLPHSLAGLADTLPFDAVETESAAEKLHYAITPHSDQKRRTDFYARVTKPRIGASDTHDPESVAECYTLAKCAATPEALRQAILSGNTSAVAEVSDADEKAVTRRSLPRALSFYHLLTDLSPLARKYLGSDDISISLLPRPVIRFTKRF